jgi:hypothetical protein
MAIKKHDRKSLGWGDVHMKECDLNNSNAVQASNQILNIMILNF